MCRRGAGYEKIESSNAEVATSKVLLIGHDHPNSKDNLKIFLNTEWVYLALKTGL